MSEDEQPKVEEQPKSVEDQISEINSQLKEVIDQNKNLEENWKNEQRTSSKKERDNQDLQRRLDDKGDQEDFTKAVVGLLAEKGRETEEDVEQEVKTRKPDLMKVYEQDKTKRETERRSREQARLTEIGEQYRKKVENIGLTDSDVTYYKIRDSVVAGNFEEADKMIENYKEKPKEKYQPTQEEKEEIAREVLEKKGSLNTETGGPSASSGSPMDKIKRFSEGDKSVSRQDYEKAMEEITK